MNNNNDSKTYKQSIMFLLPGFSSYPVGGYKIIFEYANRLAQEGYLVKVAYATYNPLTFRHLNLRKKLATLKRLIIGYRGFTARQWFPLNSAIEEIFPRTLSYKTSLKADVYIATACITADFVAKYPNGRKFYFIQDYETWDMTEEELRKTYELPLTKIVISNWLSEIIQKSGQQCHVVPNGFDTKQYYLTIPIEEKKKYQISVLYHSLSHKDFPTALRALKLVYEKVPNIKVIAFGAEYPEEDLPSWIEFEYSPSPERHLQINNESSIYVAASCSEGWGLTVGEAMMCGQAVVCTNAEGFLEMAIHDRNALVSSIRDAESLANNMLRLLEDDTLRYRIAHKGLEDIKKFDIEESYRKFYNITKN